MLFNIYGTNSGAQLLGWLCAFLGLILLNELARRTKAGGLFVFGIVPAILTVYFIALAVGAHSGAEWAVNNQTVVQMNGWFHYAKLYAALAGCIGFMVIKYQWGSLGKAHWFRAFPFVIVGINILIAVASDFESAINGANALAATGTRFWLSSEGVWRYGGWWNWVNGIAGIINIFCMTSWFHVYSSKDKKDMLWPDMTWQFILAYDVWNFMYTYANLPNHSWYCGVALLLAPTFAATFWNRGGWIQNRANTLAIWCMFAQVWPNFQEKVPRLVMPSLYPEDYIMDPNVMPASADPTMYGVVAMLALIINVVVLALIIKKSVIAKKNPYTDDVFVGQHDFEEAAAKIDKASIV